MKPSDSHQQHRNTAEGRAILDGLPAIAWCKLPDGSNEFVNQRWPDYTGIPPDEARSDLSAHRLPRSRRPCSAGGKVIFDVDGGI
jgi:PAS domain-containing protein